MSTGTPHLKVVNRFAAKPRSMVAHGFAFALAVAVIPLVGMTGDAASAQTAAAMISEVEVARPPRETVYFPSQHVSQGMEIPDSAPTF